MATARIPSIVQHEARNTKRLTGVVVLRWPSGLVRAFPLQCSGELASVMMTEPRYDQISLRSFVTDKVTELRLLTIIVSIPNCRPQYPDMNQQSCVCDVTMARQQHSPFARNCVRRLDLDIEGINLITIVRLRNWKCCVLHRSNNAGKEQFRTFYSMTAGTASRAYRTTTSVDSRTTRPILFQT